ncbi:MAG: hypothetical protein HC896_09930 [Bacteroidales bacterium]|nr:hypothetical protein [Bacteroidales bacterium]
MDEHTQITVKSIDNDTQQISLTGNVTIDNITEIHKHFKKIKLKKNTQLAVGNVAEIDLAGIQLINSLALDCTNANSIFNIESGFNKEISLLLTNTGFRELVSS